MQLIKGNLKDLKNEEDFVPQNQRVLGFGRDL